VSAREAQMSEGWADLEQLKQVYIAAIHGPQRDPLTGAPLSADIVIVPNKDDAAMLLKLVHEQALLVGAHSPKQIAVTKDEPVVNEQALEYSRGVVRFMELADKIAASGYGSGRSEPVVDVDVVMQGDVTETPEKPELLRQYEAGELEEYRLPRPQQVGHGRQRESRKTQDDDDDD
jgi:hypothetical protein